MRQDNTFDCNSLECWRIWESCEWEWPGFRILFNI